MPEPVEGTVTFGLVTLVASTSSATQRFPVPELVTPVPEPVTSVPELVEGTVTSELVTLVASTSSATQPPLRCLSLSHRCLSLSKAPLLLGLSHRSLRQAQRPNDSPVPELVEGTVPSCESKYSNFAGMLQKIAHIATKPYLCTQKHFISMNKTIQVVAAIIHDSEGRIFATQRGYGDFKDYWEFPGGKMEAGETAEEALKREIWEELETRIVVERFVMTVEWDYPQFHLTMHCYLCHVESGHLELKEHEAARWLSKDELDNVEWLPADLQIITLLKDS